MKKRIIAIIMLLIICLSLCSCNRQIIDTNWSFDYAYICLGNGTVVEGKVDSWKDWDDSDMIQVKIDGKTYYTHSNNVVLIDY